MHPVKLTFSYSPFRLAGSTALYVWHLHNKAIARPMRETIVFSCVEVTECYVVKSAVQDMLYNRTLGRCLFLG